jgi:DNA-binding CsgD family transcriptional regulator
VLVANFSAAKVFSMDRSAPSANLSAVIRLSEGVSPTPVEQAAQYLGWRSIGSRDTVSEGSTVIDVLPRGNGELVVAGLAPADDPGPRAAVAVAATVGVPELAHLMVEAARRQAHRSSTSQRRRWVDRIVGSLSKREQLILRMVFDECPNTEIASVCSVSVRTIESARGKIFRELGVKTVVGLARLIAETGFYDDAPADYLPVSPDQLRHLAGEVSDKLHA